MFDVVTGNRRERATLPLVGSHNIHNALAAVAVALERGISLTEAVASLATMAAADKRGQVVRIGNITVINDCYNSNPKALAAMVNALAEMPAKRRIVVAGEMLELGPQGAEMHREAGQHIAKKRIDVLVGVRGLAQEMVNAAKENRYACRISSQRGDSRRVAGPRDTGRRRRPAESVARSEAGKGARKAVSHQPSALSRTKADDRRPTTDD